MKSVDTILFIDGWPVDYKVTYRKDTYYFEPIFNPYIDLNAPSFSAIYSLGNYEFVATTDVSLQDQAIEDIKRLF